MVGQEGESEGTELKRPALLWFAVHILVLPVSTTGNKQPYRLHVHILLIPFFFVPVPVSRIEPDMASCMRIYFSSSIPCLSCYTNVHALIIPVGVTEDRVIFLSQYLVAIAPVPSGAKIMPPLENILG